MTWRRGAAPLGATPAVPADPPPPKQLATRVVETLAAGVVRPLPREGRGGLPPREKGRGHRREGRGH